MSINNSVFADKKMQKSLLNLRYLAYVFLVIVGVIGFGLSTYYAIELFNKPGHSSNHIYIIAWLLFIFFITIMIFLGINDVIKMLNNLSKGNIFTHENANILKSVDKKLLITLLSSVSFNMIMAIINFHNGAFMLVWLVFIGFILAGHVIVSPLALLVEKSAEMQIEMELTI